MISSNLLQDIVTGKHRLKCIYSGIICHVTTQDSVRSLLINGHESGQHLDVLLRSISYGYYIYWGLSHTVITCTYII